jgi:hypothetical protein
MIKYDMRLETKTYYNKRIFAGIFYAKGNQDKSWLNLNSDAHTDAKLKASLHALLLQLLFKSTFQSAKRTESLHILLSMPALT